MYVSFTKFSARSGLLLLLLSFAAAFAARGQASSSGAYKILQTAVNTVVRDTVFGLNLSVYVINNGNHGIATRTLIGNSNSVKTYRIDYQPFTNYIGYDTVVVEMDYDSSYPYRVYQAYRISVLPSILTPKTDFALTAIGTPVTIPVLSNDTGSNGPFNVSGVPMTNFGTASVNPNGSITFTPNAGFSGIAHFNYIVCDALGNCKTESVNVSVTNTPAQNDSMRVATAKNTPLHVPLMHGNYAVFTAPAHGTVMMTNGQVFRYSPSANFSGVDNFVLLTTASGDTTYTVITVDVLNTPYQNKMAMEDYVYTPKNQAIIFNVKHNDIGNLIVKGIILPSNFPGTINYWQGNGQMKFTPNANFSGVASFQYYIGTTAHPNLETTTVNLMVGNMNPSQGIFDLTTPMETPLVINYQIPFIGFDFAVLNPPDEGDLDIHYGYDTITINGQTVSGYNMLVYTPDNGFEGGDEFELNYCIAATNQCQTVKVAVEVTDVSSGSAPFCVSDCVWSGDINYDGIVNNKDLLPLGYFMGFEGEERDNASLEWYGQFADDWANPFAGILTDLKHADTDGNGAVSAEDTLAISLFYGQTHSILPNILSSSKGLPFFLTLLTPSNPGVGDLVEIEVSLGKLTQPLTNIYGYTFNMSLSPQLVDSAFQMDFYDNTWFNYNAPSLNLQKRPRVGRLETAITRTNGVSASGFGKVGKVKFIVDEILDGTKPDGQNFNLPITIDGAEIMLSDGSILSGQGPTLELPISLNKYPEAVTEVRENDLFVYPNPTSDLLQIHLNGNNQIEEFQILDLAGREVWNSGEVQWKHAEIRVSDFPSGVYFAVAKTAAGRVTKKFEKI